MAITYLTANFTLQEFQRASQRPLTGEEIKLAAWWATEIMQPLRRKIGKGVVINSYVRIGAAIGGGSHAFGGAVDIDIEGDDPADLERAFQWLATYKLDKIGRLIHERDHLHIARRGPESWAGNGVVLREPREGEYVLGFIARDTLNLLAVAILIVLLLLAVL